MNIDRRAFNIIGASIPLGNLLAVGYPVTPPAEKMIAVVVTPFYKEWTRDKDWRSIYDQLAWLMDHEWFRRGDESNGAIKQIAEIIAEETTQERPRTLQVSLSEEGEIGWSFIDDTKTFEQIDIVFGEKGTLAV
jgi:hypothetical protein